MRSKVRHSTLPFFFLGVCFPRALSAATQAEETLGATLSLWWIAPFALLLLAIAILPLASPHWWEKNLNKALVSLLIGIPVGITIFLQDPHALEHTMLEYAGFIALLSSLFIISGGIYLEGSLAGTPLFNTALLAAGGLLASCIGTTGASMVFIRPLLRANEKRRSKTHLVIFFIFIVSNIGGCLTPLGDPPLFLGFLEGVPFEWPLRWLWPEWATACAILLALFHIWDSNEFHREQLKRHVDLDAAVERHKPFRIRGGINLLLLLGVVGVAFYSGRIALTHHLSQLEQVAFQIFGMAFLVAISLFVTPKSYRIANGFNYAPIIEVAVLFAGIFLSMIPALLILRARGEALGVTQPWQYFWATGLLSSFLDNAPTYLAFLNLARGSGLEDQVAGVTHEVLRSISLGAVFMGANTYIGNGPNFMVRLIAEQSGVRMPSFFGYMGYSVLILIPLFLICTAIFFL